MHRTFVFAIVALALAASLPAQEFRGTILGRVTDSSGGVVANAAVSVTNQDTNTVVKSTTTASRNLHRAVPAARYLHGLRAVAGFRAFERQGIVVQVQDRIEINVVLEPGQVTETVVVRGETPLLETATGSVGQVVDQTSISNLPMNGRAVYLMARIVPGMVPTDTRLFTRPFDNGAVSNVSMGGSRAASNNILLDGISNMNIASQVAFVPSPDAIQEMKVQINTYDAEFGRAAGGVLNAIVKSGTNQFHGSLYEFWRNDKLEANSFINNSVGEGKPRQRYNLFGATGGGPLYIPKVYDGRNRTFVFGSWESIRQADPTSTLTTVPTLEQREGDFSKTFDPQGRPLVIYDPFTGARQPGRGRRLPARSVPRQSHSAHQHGPGGPEDHGAVRQAQQDRAPVPPRSTISSGPAPRRTTTTPSSSARTTTSPTLQRLFVRVSASQPAAAGRRRHLRHTGHAIPLPEPPQPGRRARLRQHPHSHAAVERALRCVALRQRHRVSPARFPASARSASPRRSKARWSSQSFPVISISGHRHASAARATPRSSTTSTRCRPA